MFKVLSFAHKWSESAFLKNTDGKKTLLVIEDN